MREHIVPTLHSGITQNLITFSAFHPVSDVKVYYILSAKYRFFFFFLYNRPLTQCYQEVARSVFLSTGDKKRKSHSEYQEKVNVLWANAKLFDKGIKLFAGKCEKNYLIK